MDRIEAVSGVTGASMDTAHQRSLPLPSTVRRMRTAPATPAEPAGPPGAGSGETAGGQVRAGPIGGDGRFEKLILAVQVLRLGFRVEEHATGPRVREMREAAEEIFSIDGVPQPVAPAAEASPAAELPTAQAASGDENPPALREPVKDVPANAPRSAPAPAAEAAAEAAAGAAAGAAAEVAAEVAAGR